MKKILAIFSLIGFGISFIIHLATFGQINLVTDSVVLNSLHLGAMIAFGSIMLVTDLKGDKSFESQLYNWKQILGPVPHWGRVLVISFCIYGVITFFTAYNSMIGLPISAREIYGTRLASGFWMMFFLIPAMFFLHHRSRKNRKHRDN